MTNWLRRALPVVLMCTPLVVTITATPALAQQEIVRRDTQGYQAGQILNDDCTLTDAGQKLVSDKDMQARSGWLRLNMIGASDTAGCKRGTYANLLNNTNVEDLNRIDQSISVIGLLTSEFHNGGPAEFAEAAKNIACDSAFDQVDVWEIGNEPDLDPHMTEALYAEILARTSKAIHDVCPNEKVISAGLTAWHPIEYLHAVDDAMAANPDWGYSRLRDAVQGLGLHPYVDAIRTTATGTRHVVLETFIRAFTENSGNGFVGMDIYLTEFGWRLPQTGTEPNDADEVTDVEQCANLQRAFNTVENEYWRSDEHVKAATWFTLKDWTDDNRRFGIWDEAGTTARLARDGYVNDDCDGLYGAFYNADEEWIEWPGIAALATVSYEVMLAPANTPYYTYTKATSTPKLLMTAFNPPLPVGDYVYRVTKIVDGKRYPSKDEWSFTYLGKPQPPSGLTATAAANGTSITLNWTDLSHNETGFNLTDGTNYRSAGANATSFTWTGLAPGVAYCFRINAYNAYGASRWNNVAVCATTPTAPTAPSNVTATVVTGTSVRIDWTDNAANETGYEINDGTTTQLAGANATSHTWGGIANGATKCFKVRAVNAVGWSAWNGNACATTPTIPVAPASPTAAAATGTSIKVTWTDRSTNEWGFEIHNGTTSQVVGANIKTYTWTGIPNGTTMCFRVRAYNLAGYSGWTANVCAATPTIPIAPQSPTATPASGTSITVKWADKSANEIGFEISNGSTSNVIGANATSFTWGGLGYGTYMCFRVRSYNLAGYSAWTGYACATTPTVPIAPQSPTATPISTSQITVKWADKSTNETAFDIYNGVSTISVGANLTSYTWSGLAPGTYMCFAVRSRNLAGASAWTPYACATTPAPPPAPSNQNAAPTSTSQIKVTWLDRSSNETGFQVYDGVNYYNVGANQTVFYRSGLASKTYMCFAIRSYNAYGYSAWTPYACTTTL